ncbi:hypothetical protein E1258_01015 [Micromonospora sp. KC207]|uniref:hypothetical protein n=1 Tax=Micromonospora sp. KC207 TaxID=2530377 RepID=UPI00104EC288|nr:hypothetical protein [Micromonospora sp. KC207]TDC67111.1 hypothetical protein E1258_01015 [Micromonospora sp. KC207]
MISTSILSAKMGQVQRGGEDVADPALVEINAEFDKKALIDDYVTVPTARPPPVSHNQHFFSPGSNPAHFQIPRNLSLYRPVEHPLLTPPSWVGGRFDRFGTNLRNHSGTIKPHFDCDEYHFACDGRHLRTT